MGAVKEMIGELGSRGYIPVDASELNRWDAATGHAIRTAEVTVEVRGRSVTEVCLPADVARRLAADTRLDAADRESLRWRIEVAGIPGEAGCCPRCGDDNVTFFVGARMIDNLLVVHNADEPEGPAASGMARCEECDCMVPVEFPAWTAQHRLDALAAFNGPRLRDALAALHRAAVEAGVTGTAVERAAMRLRGCEVEPADPLEGYKQRTAERMKRLDALDGRCAWGADFPTTEQERARKSWKTLMDEQGADEVANGL